MKRRRLQFQQETTASEVCMWGAAKTRLQRIPASFQSPVRVMPSAAEARALYRAFLRSSQHFGTSYNIKE